MKTKPAKPFGAINSNPKTWVGVGLVFLAALGVGTNILIANMAYRDGVDVHTVNAARHIVTVTLLFLFLKLRGRQLKLPPRDRYTGFALGITVFMMGVGYLGATQYIPVSVAVLIFYTHPFMVALIARFTENEPITPIRLMAITIAFIGLVFAMGIDSVAGLSWYGIAYGFLAALGAASFVTVSSLAIRTADPQTVNIHCLTAGTVLYVALMFISGGPAENIVPAGWFKMGLSGLALTIAYVTLFIGLEIIGPVKTSLLLNAEPIITIILAAILLGERLAFTQLIGAAFVMAGIIMITREYINKRQ
jgi:drug/metabolite transporter (DMT)-like permease